MIARKKDEENLTQSEKQMMFLAFMRYPQVFKSMRSFLDDRMFSVRDVLYAATWRALCKCWDQHEQLPIKEMLKTSIQSEIDRAPGMFHGDDLSDFNDFIDVAYDSELDEDVDTLERYVKDLVFRFATESVAIRASEQLASARPADVNSLLEKFSEEIVKISAVSGNSATTLCFGEDWQPTRLVLSSTGIGFVNKLLGGGQAEGEVYGVIGPNGSCKSTLGVQIVCAATRMQSGIEAVPDGESGEEPPPVVNYLISYEDGTDLLYARIFGNLAEVDVTSIQEAVTLENLSHADSLKEYERQMPCNLPKPRYGEYERVMAWRPIARRHICAMDFTGQNDTWRGCGAGGVPEIVQQIQRDLRNRPEGTKVGTVVIDYCGAMIDRMESLRARDAGDLSRAIRKSVLDVKHQIAIRFRCPVFYLHQLSGNANKRRSGSVASQHEAAGSSSWAEHLVFSLVIGKPDKANRTIIECQKHRRSAPTGRCILAVEGQFSRVKDISDAFCVQSGSKIVAKEDLGVQVMPKAVKRHSNLSNLDQG